MEGDYNTDFLYNTFSMFLITDCHASDQESRLYGNSKKVADNDFVP